MNPASAVAMPGEHFKAKGELGGVRWSTVVSASGGGELGSRDTKAARFSRAEC